MISDQLQAALGDAGIASLKPLQELCITQILQAAQGNAEIPNRRIIILPTGYGKTLCFSIPAVLLPHPTLIVYPLRALMADQARRFSQSGISAELLIGGLEPTEMTRRLENIKAGKYKLIVANPEILATERVKATLAKLRFSHVVIDEAHVIHQWGTTFRPAYRELEATVRLLAPDQVSAFTATADAAAIRTLREFLGDAHLYELKASSDRPEISYRVITSPLPDLTLQSLISSIERPAVVFLRNRALCESFCLRLRHLNAIQRQGIRFYHAGLSRSERLHLEHWFLHAKDAVLISTNAYGMGVDKSNIRTVLHFGLPDSAASYLQESGRAGRDGAPAQAICLLGQQKPSVLDPALLAFASGERCRRQTLLDAVDGQTITCSGCDVCNPEMAKAAPELSELFAFIKKNPGQYTLAELGKELHRAGSLGYLGRAQIRALLKVCLSGGVLRESYSPLNWRRLVVGRKTDTSIRNQTREFGR